MLSTPVIVTDLRLSQYLKASSSMIFTESGIVIDPRPSHILNAFFFILVTVSGIVTSPEQVEASIRIPFTTTSGSSFCLFSNHFVRLNASSPILVTVSGILIVSR